jgi:hypothetical protein
MTDGASASLAILEARIASIPAALAEAAALELPRALEPRTVVTTGIGASEGPARLLAVSLTEAGRCARFVPLSAFVIARPRADLLVVFSQGLSPNARLALGHEHDFGARWLVTSEARGAGSKHDAFLEPLEARGLLRIVMPPRSEADLLLRVVGPAAASLLALRLAALLGATELASTPFDEAAGAYAAPDGMLALREGALAIVTAGVPFDVTHGHRWKMLEGLLEGDVPAWDALQFAHGPMQALYEREATLIGLATPGSAELLARVQGAIATTKLDFVPIVARRTDALSFFEHAAALDALLVATLRERPRDLRDWPGRGADTALYGLGDP